MAIIKKSGSGWHAGFGNELMEKGVHRWRLTDIAYP